MRAREIEGEDLVPVANENYLVAAVDVGTICRRNRIREQLPPGNGRRQHLGRRTPDGEAQRDCGESKRGHVAQELPSLGNERAALAGGWRFTIYHVRGLHFHTTHIPNYLLMSFG